MTKKYSEHEAELIMLKNSLKPLEPYKNTQEPWLSECLKCNSKVSPRLQKVLIRGHQCKFCSKHVINEDDAVKLMKKAGFTPVAKYPGANKPWQSKCSKCKKITSPTFTAVKSGIGCKYCGKRAIDPLDADKAIRKRGFKPIETFPGAVLPWKVQCQTCMKIFTIKLHSLNTSTGCKYCEGVEVDIKDLHRKLKELKLMPLVPYKSAKTPWKCKCLNCGHIVQPTWNRIKQKRGHCAYCAKRRVYIPDALKLLKKLNLKPLIEFPGNNKPWQCLCLSCGEIVQPRWSDLNRGQGGCSNCADYGLNYTKPGYLYLMINSHFKAGKIGIGNSYKGNSGDDRIKRHEKQNWKLVCKHDFQKLSDAYHVEQKIIKWLRTQISLPIFLNPDDMPQGGWTETFETNLIDINIIVKKIENEFRIISKFGNKINHD